MDISVLKSYLVNLGFKVDQPELRKFEGGLKDAGNLVASTTGGVVKDLIKWQTEATAAFVGISGAIVAMAGSVADSDQKYRLLGLRMFMTAEQAKKMQVGLKALDVTLEDAIWDPEVNARFLRMSDLQDKLAAKMGAGFKADMIRIRDLQERWEELKFSFTDYIIPNAIGRLVEKFGPDLDAIQAKVEGFIAYVTDHLPEWADSLSDNVLPILKDTWDILNAIGEALKATAVAFTNVVSLLSGDDTISGTEFSFNKLADAIQHVTHFAAEMVITLAHAEEMLAHLASAVSLAIHGHFEDAAKELGVASKLFTPGVGGVLGGAAGTGLGMTAGGLWGTSLGAAAGTALLPGIGTWFGGAVGGALGTAIGGAGGGALIGGAGAGLAELIQMARGGEGGEATGAPSTFQPLGDLAELVASKARAIGLDPRLAQALAQQESRIREYGAGGGVLTSSAGALGVMQLMPATARGLGVDPSDAGQNIEGGERMLKRLMDKYGSIPQALAAYNWGEGHLDRALSTGRDTMPIETVNYVRDIMARMGQPITVGDVHISVMHPQATTQEVHEAAMKGMGDALARERQRTMAQLANAY